MAITLTPSLTPASGVASAPLQVAFDVAVAGSVSTVTYLWDFGDGNSATTKSGAHTYVAGRSYPVSLTVRDATDQTATWTTTHVVNAILEAGFTATVSIGGGGEISVAVVNTTTGGTAPVTYLWDWGDNTSDTGASPAPHVYTEAGYYTIKLTATDAQSHVSRISRSVAVEGTIAVAVSAIVPTITSAPVTIAFSAVASQGVAPYTYTWSFGDGATATGANVTHTFETHGTFEIAVAVVDALGHDAGGRINIDVLEHLRSDPDRIPEKGLPILPVTFYAHTVGGKKPYTYFWDFQDGFTSTEANPKHNFEKIGFYNVTVQITDAQGNSHTMTTAVDVGALPPPPPGGSGLTIYLWGVTIYTWDFTIYGHGGI